MDIERTKVDKAAKALDLMLPPPLHRREIG